MKIAEIYTNPSRDESVQDFARHFSRPQQQRQLSNGFDNLAQLEEELCHLGVFEGGRLISYLSLHRTDNFWQVDMQCTERDRRGQGFVRANIEWAIDLFGCIISDSAQTAEAQQVWTALIKHPNLYHYSCYELDSGLQQPLVWKQGAVEPNPWDQTEHTVILACSRTVSTASTARLEERIKFEIRNSRKSRWIGQGFTEFNP